MRKPIIASLLTFSAFQITMAQIPKEADPADVASIDTIMKAVYSVISGDAGKPRDWDRFRTLFHKDARLIPSGTNPNTKVTGANALTTGGLYKARRARFCQRRFSRTRACPSRRYVRQYRTGFFDLSRVSQIDG